MLSVMTSPSSSLLARFQAWLGAQLGPRYAAVLQIIGRVIGVFLLAVAVKAISLGITLPGITSLAWWHAVLFAGVGALLTLITSVINAWITGHPAFLAYVSTTIRAQRDFGGRVLHRVPLVMPRVTHVRPEHEA